MPPMVKESIVQVCIVMAKTRGIATKMLVMATVELRCQEMEAVLLAAAIPLLHIVRMHERTVSYIFHCEFLVGSFTKVVWFDLINGSTDI
jgi:hypothetical protein